MIIRVTNHAVERFAERIIGVRPTTLAEHERRLIRDAIAKAVANSTGPKRYVCTPLATYAVHNGVVKTVLPPVSEMIPERRGRFLGRETSR